MSEPDYVIRPDFKVIARLLERLWRARGPMKKTKLQTGANMNYDTFTKYLSWMQQRRLVEVSTSETGVDQVVLTVKGLNACLSYIEFLGQIIDEWTIRDRNGHGTVGSLSMLSKGVRYKKKKEIDEKEHQ